jgi:hypothetical protein
MGIQNNRVLKEKGSLDPGEVGDLNSRQPALYLICNKRIPYPLFNNGEFSEVNSN